MIWNFFDALGITAYLFSLFPVILVPQNDPFIYKNLLDNIEALLDH